MKNEYLNNITRTSISGSSELGKYVHHSVKSFHMLMPLSNKQPSFEPGLSVPAHPWTKTNFNVVWAKAQAMCDGLLEYV